MRNAYCFFRSLDSHSPGFCLQITILLKKNLYLCRSTSEVGSDAGKPSDDVLNKLFPLVSSFSNR